PQLPRPELWVFAALLGSQAMTVLALALTGMADTPAVALLGWSVAGLAGRFKGLPLLIGTGYAVAIALVGRALQSSQGPGDPIVWTVALTGLLAVCMIAATLRDSDLHHRSAAILDGLTGMLNRTALSIRTAEVE